MFRDRDFLGSIAAVFSVEGILKHDIPPELSAKYKISIIDLNNRELPPRRPARACRATCSTTCRSIRRAKASRCASTRTRRLTNFTNNTLVWLVAGLSCFVLWSLWSLWKHTRQRFEAQQALYAEAFFRRAMENSVLIGMRVLDMHGRITHVNPAFCRMTGWDESDLVGKNAPFPYWPRDAYPEMQRQLDMTLRGKAPSSGLRIAGAPQGRLAVPRAALRVAADRQLGPPDRLDVVDDRHHRAQARARGTRRRARALHHGARKPRRRRLRARRRRSRTAVRQPLLPASVRHSARTAIWNWRAAGSTAHRRRRIRSTWWIPTPACPPPR